MAIMRILDLFNNACSATPFNGRTTVYGEFERLFLEAVNACFKDVCREGLRKFKEGRSFLLTYEGL